ncbi:MAG: mandelate racemase/muconate lactonizing enzyme family protein [Haloferacaceae archaeon]
MRLRDATVRHLRVPLRGSYSASVHEGLSTMESALVVLETPDGERGIGTADPSPGYSRQTAADIVADLDGVLPGLVDDPPATPNDLRDRLAGSDAGPNAALAVETAFLDLHGRRHGLSIADYFGGARRRTEPLNAWVGFDDPSAMADEAADWHDRGFESCKLKLSGDPDLDVDRVRTVIDRLGDRMAIRADANGAYDVDDALAVARELDGSGLVNLEQPVPQEDLDGLARVTAATEDLSIGADEPVTDRLRLFEILKREAADRVKLKVLRLGGVGACQEAIGIANAAGVAPIVGHGFCLSPAGAAEIGLVATREEGSVLRPVESVGPLKAVDEPFEPRLEMDDGRVRLPGGPGHGVRLDDDALDEFAV